jgi:thiol-disulfide isomerase/thioredoxin
MKRSQILLIGFTAAMIALVAGVYVAAGRSTPAPAAALADGALARLFAARLPDADGKAQAIAQWQGKILVINFWASWCPPCRDEMPAFSRLQTKHAANGVQFVGIAIDTQDNVVDFARNHPVSYPLLIADSEGIELARQLGNSRLALPYTIVIAPTGEVRLTRLGRVSEQELDALLPELPAR